jgi:hypothetical protein
MPYVYIPDTPQTASTVQVPSGTDPLKVIEIVERLRRKDDKKKDKAAKEEKEKKDKEKKPEKFYDRKFNFLELFGITLLIGPLVGVLDIACLKMFLNALQTIPK